MSKKARSKRKTNPHEGSTLDSLFEELGELQEVQEIALRKALAAELATLRDQVCSRLIRANLRAGNPS